MDIPCPIGLIGRINFAPKDELAMDQLIHTFAQQFIYSLHELPAGVLDGMNGATSEACRIYEKEVQEFEELLQKRDLSEKYDELVQDCKFHYKNYRIYLENKAHYKSYEDYLSKLDAPKK